MSFTIARRHPLPIPAVKINDAFWSPKRDIVRRYSLKQQEYHLRTGGQFDALTLRWRPGDPNEPHIFWDSDVAKWIEAASYVLARQPDAELEASVDEAIALLAHAQQDDGYLNTYFTAVKPGERFTDLQDAHELYCAGHLIEAGVAHFHATGKRTLLDIVQRYADLIDHEFGPGGSADGGYDGHEEIELALIKLYHATGDVRYLNLSRKMIADRGTQPYYFDLERARRGHDGYFEHLFPDRAIDIQRYREYNQTHLPVTEQTEAVGHAVRAMYLYAAMTDLAAEYDDDDLLQACVRLWDSVTEHKMYVTGGIGSDHTIEGFGPDYDLPDAHGYAETCAAIGLVLWAHRMALLTGDARYADVMERALYNGVLSGASEDGTRYFYGNPLASAGSVHRHEWFGVACCPPNFARVLSSLEHYIWAATPTDAIVNLFVSSTADFTFTDTPVRLTQTGDYPAGGTIRIRVSTPAPVIFRLHIRIPGWSHDATLTVNGIPRPLPDTLHQGYAVLDRRWDDGDEIELDLPMPITRIWADPAVQASAGSIALTRGPIVYCLEGIDNGDPVASLSLPRDAHLSPAPTGAVPDLVTPAGLRDEPSDPRRPLYVTQPPSRTPTTITAIPYYTWANRGDSTMTVWIRETSDTPEH